MATQYPAQQLANALTLADHKLMLPLQPEEFTKTDQGRVAWMLPDKLTRSPNIIATIKHTDHTSWWAITEVLKQPTPEKRAEVIGHLVEVLEALLKLLSYNSLAAITHALSHGSIDRLTKTWKLVPEEKQQRLVYFRDLVKPPFRTYSRITADHQPDWLPFLGVCLHEIHNLEASFRDSSQKTDAIQAVLTHVLTAIQKSKFNVNAEPKVTSYLAEFVPFDSAEAYKASAAFEPKEVPQPLSEDDSQSEEGLTSNPVFFYGAPALAVAAIAATIGFLLYRKHHSNH